MASYYRDPVTGEWVRQSGSGKDGTNGADGYTPVRGVDYWNAEDIAAMKAENEAYIIEELSKRNQTQLEFVDGIEAMTDTTKLYVYDGYIYAYKLTEVEVEDGSGGYTNVLPTATDTDRTTIYGESEGTLGYRKGQRLSSSGSTSSNANVYSTGFIPVKDGDVVRIKGIKGVGGTTTYIISYDSANTKLAYQKMPTDDMLLEDWAADGVGDLTYFAYDAESHALMFSVTSANFGSGIDAIRFSCGYIDANTIVTVNEKIVEGGGTEIITEYAWVSTGHAFVPADYEGRIIALEEETAQNTADIAALKKGAVDTGGVDALTWIRNWDSPIYDRVPVFQISAENPAVTSLEKTVDAVYAKYDALVAANPRYITKTNMGMCSDGVTPVCRYDFCEPEPHHQSGQQWSETKPTIIIVSGIHIEWGGIYSLYYALKEITENPELDDLRRNVHFVVVPVMNPYCIVGAYNTTFGVQNANGVEIHRNFEVGFKYPGQSGYIEPGNRSHGGTEPLSEVESQYIDNLFKEFPDAALFMTCHSAQRDTRWGTGFIWASTATNYTCNLGYRLVDKMSKAWHKKYGTTWEEGCVRENEYVLADTTAYPNATALAEGDYRAGHAHVSATNGTETRQATKYGIQGANVEVLDTFWVLSDTGLDSKVTTHGAEVYINYLLMYMDCYDHKDKKQYYIQ